ncbi:SURF1 family protein [Defluviimonas sp. WL0024]|uniref:SURF1-like protein n=2 Tax=Albidovulum TaxID=205889 RepID=A0ABT3J020_9RHOB|nr:MULTISPECIES: SURF1 family protein [Defluviimonas]MCU9847220.1 SURF1 family protein [Defluviimonas sp. WL0024]MCW3781020.1 SURF1 family protein [Defluviimonas salinarum]
MNRALSALILGALGIAVLLSLGVWQLRRLAWKEGVIAAIEAQIGADPVRLSTIAAPDPAADLYRPVTVSGRTTGEELLVLSGRKGEGAGFEVIAVFETDDGKRVLLDRGFVPEAARDDARPAVALEVTGNLHWPREADSYTPPPDAATGLWFARDVAAMSENVNTMPLLVVARKVTGDAQGIVPVPVDTSSIPNDHRQYAITWFSLAGVWAGMTGFLLWRIRQRTD